MFSCEYWKNFKISFFNRIPPKAVSDVLFLVACLWCMFFATSSPVHVFAIRGRQKKKKNLKLHWGRGHVLGNFRTRLFKIFVVDCFRRLQVFFFKKYVSEHYWKPAFTSWFNKKLYQKHTKNLPYYWLFFLISYNEYHGSRLIHLRE